MLWRFYSRGVGQPTRLIKMALISARLALRTSKRLGRQRASEDGAKRYLPDEWELRTGYTQNDSRVRKTNQHGRSVAHDPANVLSLSRSRPPRADRTDTSTYEAG